MQIERREAETGDRTSKRRPKDNKNLGIDTRPIEVRLRDLATPVPDADGADEGVLWSGVLAKIHALPFMRRGDKRVAGLRKIDEMVDTSGHALSKPLFVDAAGMLRTRAVAPIAVAPKGPMSDTEVEDYVREHADPWLSERKVGGSGSALYWFVAVQRTDRVFAQSCPNTGVPLYARMTRVSYRQRDRLSAADVATFRSFPSEVQAKLLAEAPR